MDVYLSYCFNYCIREAFSNHCKIDEMYCVRRSPTNFFYFHCWFSLIWYLHIIYSQPASFGLLWPRFSIQIVVPSCYYVVYYYFLYFQLRPSAPLVIWIINFLDFVPVNLKALSVLQLLLTLSTFILFYFFCVLYTSKRFATKSWSTVGGFLVWVGGWFRHLFPENQRNSQAE